MSGAIRNSSGEDDFDSDEGEVFLDEDDVINEIPIDEEELPDRDDEEMDSDVDYEEADDSFYVFKGHTDELYSVACSPTDASLVATGGKDDRGFMWKIGSQDSGLELQGHRNTVSTLAFSSDGQFLATGSFDGLIQVWDANLGSIKCTLEGSGGGVEWLKWHPKGHLILAGSEDSSVWLWNADKSVTLNTFYGHASSVTCGDFSPDGKIICTGSDDASLRIWNPKTGDSINVRGHPYHTDGLTCLSITHDSTIALTGSKDSSVHMVNLATGRVISSLVSHSDSVECLGVSPSSHWAATGSLDQKLIIWDLERSSPRCTCEHDVLISYGQVISHARVKSCHVVLELHQNLIVFKCSLHNFERVRQVSGSVGDVTCSTRTRKDGVTCLLWLGMSRFVATGSIDGKVRVWDSLSGSCVRTLSGHVDVVQSLAVTADQSSLVSVSNDGTARVFRISEFR